MIPNHPQFIAAIQAQQKVSVRFYSKPDSGVLDRVCAPMAYGPGGSVPDGLNRCWLWEYVSNRNCLSDGGGFGSAPTREEAVDRALLVVRRYLLAEGVGSGVSDTRGVSPASNEVSSSSSTEERDH